MRTIQKITICCVCLCLSLAHAKTTMVEWGIAGAGGFGALIFIGGPFINQWYANPSWDMQAMPYKCMMDEKFTNGRYFGMHGASDSSGSTSVSWGTLQDLACRKSTSYGQTAAAAAAAPGGLGSLVVTCASQMKCVVALQNRCIIYKTLHYAMLAFMLSSVLAGLTMAGGIGWMFTFEPKKKKLMTALLIGLPSPVGIGVWFGYSCMMKFTYDGLKTYEYFGPNTKTWIMYWLYLIASALAIGAGTLAFLRHLKQATKGKIKLDDIDDDDMEGEDEY